MLEGALNCTTNNNNGEPPHLPISEFLILFSLEAKKPKNDFK